MEDVKEKILDPVIKKNRRYFAWIAFGAIHAIMVILCSLVLLKSPNIIEGLKALETLLTWFLTIDGSIVLTYVGVKGIENFKAISEGRRN